MKENSGKLGDEQKKCLHSETKQNKTAAVEQRKMTLLTEPADKMRSLAFSDKMEILAVHGQ